MLTVDHDTPQVMDITGLSMAARARTVGDRAEQEKALQLLMQKYPQQTGLPLLQGLRHTDLVVC